MSRWLRSAIASAGGAAQQQFVELPMSKQHAEWKARAAECHRAALTAMERAANVTDKNTKVEFLQMATELLKLAEDIEQFIALAGESPLPN